MKKYFLLFLALGFVLVNCKKNDDEPVISDDPIDETPIVKSRADYPVQDFMWQAMNFYYWYQKNIPNLDENLLNEEKYVELLSSEENPEDFYFNKLIFSDDRFSYLSENYKDLVQGQAGIIKSNGLEFGLSRYGEGNDVFGFVRYVIKGSDASTKDIKRGDIFISVNGTPIYYNSDNDNNINELLRDIDTYTLGMADLVNNTITPNGKEVTLVKQEGLIEDPIHVTNIIDVGNKKVGYLMYNQFAGNSGEPLNDVFGEFKSAGITDLVLDLRYNLGGFAYITQILGSLIHQADPEKLFYNRRFNDKFEEVYQIEGGDKTFFVADTGTNDNNSQIPLNSLDLPKIYVIATGNSASASELLINGLRPYLEVVHIGSRTIGKNQGSITFVDDREGQYFYDENREDKINPDNQWAIQPIVSQTENSEGFGDYSEGLVPNIEFTEDRGELGVLGDPSERMLARALQEIDGASGKRDLTAKFPIDLVSSSSLQRKPDGELIFRNLPLNIKAKFNTNPK